MERLGLEGAVVPGPSLDVCAVVVLVSRWLLSSGQRHCLATGLLSTQDSLWRVAICIGRW